MTLLLRNPLSFPRVVNIIACFAIAAGLTGCGLIRSGEKHLETGKKMLKAKDYDHAILELASAVKAMPKSAEALYQLGLAYEGTGKTDYFPLAVNCLKRALQLDPKHTAARLEVSKLEALTRDRDTLSDAEKRIQQLIADTGANIESLNILAMTQWKLGNASQAVETLDQALENAPQDFRAAGLLALVKVSQNDAPGAESVLQKAITAAPRSSELPIMLARVYLYERKFPEAISQLQRALVIAPKSISALVLLGGVQVSLNQIADAERTYQTLAGLGDKNTKHLYAAFLFQQGRKDEAVRIFERLAKEDSNDREARDRLIVAYYQMGRVNDAKKVIEGALSKNRKDSGALVQRAELLALDGKYAQSETDLNEVLRLDPNSAEVHYLLAKVHQARGEDLTYRQELTEALRLRPSGLALRLELARSLLAGNDPASAIRVIDEAPKSQSTFPDLLIQRNWVLWATGDIAGMRKGIDAGLSQQRSAELLIQDGYWKVRNQNFRGAIASLEEALKSKPDSVVALEGLRQAHLAQKQGPAGLAKVKAYAALQPKSAPVQEYLGKLLLDNGDRAGARLALDAAKAAAPHTLSVDLKTVQLDIAERKMDDAAAKLKAIVSTDPRNSVAHLWLGNLNSTKGDYGTATEEYRKAVEIDANNVSALNNLAYLLSEHTNQLDEALKYAQQAKEKAPDKSEYADTLGWILYRKGVYGGAVQQLESAVAQKDASSALYQYHLAMAYLKAGNLPRAKSVYEAALKSDPTLPEAKSAKNLFAGNTQ